MAEGTKAALCSFVMPRSRTKSVPHWESLFLFTILAKSNKEMLLVLRSLSISKHIELLECIKSRLFKPIKKIDNSYDFGTCAKELQKSGLHTLIFMY
jgi:hypothetical protein